MFILKRLIHPSFKTDKTKYADPVFDGNQIHFKYNGKDCDMHHLETILFDLCLQIQKLPNGSVLEVSPHGDQVKQGTHGPITNYHHERDLGKRMTGSLTHFDKKKKKIKHGDFIFKGILKSVMDDPLELLALA